MKNLFFKKIIAVTVLTTLIMPYIADAQVVHDPAHTAVTTVNTAENTLSAAQNVMNILKEYGLDQVAYTLGQAIGQKLANKVINKAKGGASGDSSQDSYIKNYGEFFANVAAQDLDKYVSTLEISNNPYAEQLAKSLVHDAGTIAKSAASTGDPLGGFNLDRVVGTNWKDFSKDASVGGWDGILALSNPANTNIGSALIAQQALQDQIDTSKANEALKLTSTGIKPQGKCNMNIQQYKDKINTIKGAKNNIQSNKAQISNIQSANANKTFTEDDIAALQAKYPNDQIDLNNLQQYVNKDTGVTGLQQQNQSSGLAAAGAVKGLIEDYGGCVSELISNPTALVGEGLKSATAYALTQTQHIQGFGQIIAGTFISLFSSFVQTGLSSLGANFQNSRGSVGGPEQLVAKNGQTINWTQAPTTVVDLQASLEPAEKNTQAEIDLLQKYIQVVTDGTNGTLLDNMAQLDQCIPGPDFHYENRLDPYVAAQISKTQRKKDKGNDSAKESKADALSNVDASIAIAKSEMAIWTQDPTRNIPGAAMMQQQVGQLQSIRTAFKQKQDQISDKQAALSLTYNIESELSGNIQLLRPFIPTLPVRVAFTERAWNKLPAADQNTLYNWAKSIATTLTPPANPSADTKRIFALAVVWDVWSNPENYIIYKDGWNAIDPTTKTSKATDYLQGSQALTNRGVKGKNEIRAEFNSMSDRLSIQRTLDQAKLDLDNIKNTIKTTQDLLADCQHIRSLVAQNPPHGTPDQVNQNMLTVLQNATYKSDAIKQSITLPSILTETYDRFPASMDTQCGPLMCRQDAGLASGDTDLGPSPYQVQPAKSIWELLGQDTPLCSLNVYVATYRNSLSRPIIDGGKPIECSKKGWYEADKKDYVEYFYGNSLF